VQGSHIDHGQKLGRGLGQPLQGTIQDRAIDLGRRLSIPRSGWSLCVFGFRQSGTCLFFLSPFHVLQKRLAF